MSEMKKRQHGGPSPEVYIDQEQVTAINLTKHRDSTPQAQVELSDELQDTTLYNCTHKPDNRTTTNSANIPYMVNKEQDSPIYRIGKCQSGVHQDSLIQVNCQEPVDLNNNTRETTGSDSSPNDITEPDSKTGSSRHHQNEHTEVSPEDTPTTFAGLFPHISSQQMSVPAGVSDIDVYRQSYLQGRNGQQQFNNGCKQQQQFMNYEPQQQQLAFNSSSQVSGFSQYSQYGQTGDDENIAAEQLASELCSTYGGPNSHMISDILKRNVGQNYVHGGFERPSVIEDMQHFDSIVSNQHVVHDVDLLNTPQQTSVTYNDIHVHGGRWSSQKSPMYEQHAESESPFPSAIRKDTGGNHKNPDNYQIERGVYNVRTQNQQSDMSPSNFLDISQFNLSTRRTQVAESENRHIHETELFSGFKSPSSQGGGYGQLQQEITKMTFTPREMMETHLSQNYKNQKKANYGQQVSGFSSIYPSRDFIERATSQKKVKRQPAHEQKENSQPRKRSRVSKYSTDEVPKVPPQMPIFGTMFQKYVPLMPRDEIHGGRHKYFVVNPSEITHMPPKSLITKYIDFLILENEQITEISKSTNPPVDIYVTEDMYFMDTLKFQVPFPSKKFFEWVASFYPKLGFHEMKFKGRHPQVPQEGQALRPDPRPTQEILEDTFYFFQREAMNMENQRV